jgi:hypothetical protein
MTDQDNNTLLNGIVVTMAHSFLQYVAEAWTWVQADAGNIEEQVRALAARQRQDVSDIAALLTEREFSIDFGSFPTQYTDLQFLSLQKLMDSLTASHTEVTQKITDVLNTLRTMGDNEAVDLLTTIEAHEHDISKALAEVQSDLQATA